MISYLCTCALLVEMLYMVVVVRLANKISDKE